MESVARKYHSILDISYETDGFFLVQTTLQLPALSPQDKEETHRL